MVKKVLCAVFAVSLAFCFSFSVFADNTVTTVVTYDNTDLKNLVDSMSFRLQYQYISQSQSYQYVASLTPTYIQSDSNGVLYSFDVSNYSLYDGYRLDCLMSIADITGYDFNASVGVGHTYASTSGNTFNRTIRAAWNYNGISDYSGTITYNNQLDNLYYDNIVHSHNDSGTLLSFTIVDESGPAGLESYLYFRFYSFGYTYDEQQGATLDDIYNELTDGTANQRNFTLSTNQMRSLIELADFSYTEYWADPDNISTITQYSGTLVMSPNYFIGTDVNGLLYYKVPRSVLNVPSGYKAMSVQYTLDFPVNIASTAFSVIVGQMAEDMDSQNVTQTLKAYDLSGLLISESNVVNYASYSNPTGLSEPFYYSYLDLESDIVIWYDRLEYYFDSLTGMNLDTSYIYFFVSPISYTSTIVQSIDGTLNTLAEQMGLVVSPDIASQIYYSTLRQGEMNTHERVVAMLQEMDRDFSDADLSDGIVVDSNTFADFGMYMEGVSNLFSNNLILTLLLGASSIGLIGYILFGRRA